MIQEQFTMSMKINGKQERATDIIESRYKVLGGGVTAQGIQWRRVKSNEPGLWTS